MSGTRTTGDIASLARDVKVLKVYALMVTLGLGALGLMGAKSAQDPKELSVERINIVDSHGVTRLVIANAERMPLPRIDGKEYPRSIAPAGLLFYDSNGNEVGGLALSGNTERKLSALSFDYPNYDALGLLTQSGTTDQSSIAGLVVNSRPPRELDLPHASKVSQRRVAVLNENENAEVLLADRQGRDRIKLVVDDHGDPSIQILDEQGKVVFRAPTQK
jgi:hypothetical protein